MWLVVCFSTLGGGGFPGSRGRLSVSAGCLLPLPEQAALLRVMWGLPLHRPAPQEEGLQD